MSKQKTKECKKEELDTRVHLEMATAVVYDDICNVDKQGEVTQLRNKLKEIETNKSNGVAIRSRVTWQNAGDKCIAKFLLSIRIKVFS